MKKLLLLVCLFVMTTIITAFANVKFDIDEENEEDIKILQEERQKRKEELGIRSLSEDEERYASFFGTKYDIDTTKDVEVAVEFFDNMGYITEPFTQPTFAQLDRRYYTTDVVTLSGHGGPESEKGPSYLSMRQNVGENIGVKATSRNSYENDISYVGLGRRNLSFCKLMMFIACESAVGNNSVAEYAQKNGAISTLGWDVLISSKESPTWLREFYSNLEAGETVGYARRCANDTILEKSFAEKDIEKKAHLKSTTSNTLLGNKEQVLTYKRNNSKKESRFIKPDIKIHIDYENNDFSELINYLEKNVAGFDRETCKIESIHKSEENTYDIYFVKQYKGFNTDYYLYVISEGDRIEYSSTLDKFKEPRKEIKAANEIKNEIIETAKQEAIHHIQEKYTNIDSQKVEIHIDQEFHPYLIVTTKLLDEDGAIFANFYTYEIN